MDKNAIKKYAVWARNELIEKVTQMALAFGIEDGKAMDPNAESVNGTLLTDVQKKQRQALIKKIDQDGFSQVMEEVAYTWFNRFIALRFMEVNGYLPSHVRVFTDENNNFNPQILSEALHLELVGLDMEKVYAMKEANQDEDLFKYLLIMQCNALNSILPGMFQKIADYTELLLPDYLLREGSVIEQMIAMIPEQDWTDQVQIIGWLYQYYNTEPKDQVFADLKKNKKITKEKIPAATQLFTPDWIVRYMVENSLGRLWLEGHPANKEKFLPTKEEQDQFIQTHEDDGKWHYYLEEAKQEPEVQKQLDVIHGEYSALKPEDILCIDPCMGSGHIICYLFDTMVKIYEDYGYSAREAASSIVENNLWGLDIDERASQLAYFAVMMKARQYDRRFFTRGVQPHVYAIAESNHLDPNAVKYFVNGDPKLKKDMDTLISELHDAKEYGSILTVSQVDFAALNQRIAECADEISMFHDMVQNDIAPLIHVGQALAQKYHVVVTNPPYMRGTNMSNNLSTYVKKFYSYSKTDLFAVFIERCRKYIISNGLQAMITQHSWMFLSSFESLRKEIFSNTIIDMVHLGARAFEEISGEIVQTTSFVLRGGKQKKYIGLYFRLVEEDSQQIKENAFLQRDKEYYKKQEDYELIPGIPVAYWLSENMLLTFSNKKLGQYGKAQKGLDTCDVDRFVRNWFEVDFNKINFSARTKKDTFGFKWFPYSKGGEYRKWYGNQYNVVLWENDGYELRNFRNADGRLKSRPQNTEDYFKPMITWSAISSSSPSMRFIENSIYGGGGTAYIPNRNILYFLAFLNSDVALKLLQAISPTLNFEAGHIMSLPLIMNKEKIDTIEKVAKDCIQIAKDDWDSFEISWNFKRHPFIMGEKRIEKAYLNWAKITNDRFKKLKTNEEMINSLFINIYGLRDEVDPKEDDKLVSVQKAELEKDIRSFISYSVGCMFGRYSLDYDGIAYAGGIWDTSKYKTYVPDKDNIIPICDDEYFEDDIVNRFIDFVKEVFGLETLEENLNFIANAIGGKGSSREIIRNYFLNEFYKDHCKIYQKRPIYWMFDSGKKNGFKCLIYMHRYQPDTIARVRTDYVHEQQARYKTAIDEVQQRIRNTNGSIRVKLSQKLKKLQEQDEELHLYEEKIHHLADQMIVIDLNDGFKKNYARFKDVVASV